MNYKILEKMIPIDPTITQTQLEEILQFTLMGEGNANEYEKILLMIIDTFSKLHRFENLIFKIVTVINNYCEDVSNKKKKKVNLEVRDLLTTNILASISRIIQNLASWQVINVFKTLLFSLKKVVDNLNVLGAKIEYCFHLEYLSELMGTFLSSIRVAEHTVAVNVVEKTKKCQKELEDILHNLGTGLLNRKHNCSLMRSFLNMGYYWAEMNIILKYYSLNQEDKTKASALDYNLAACNITYIHPYLSIDEWCSISERITNFGEVSCKQLLYKLFVQKVQALYIFEEKVSEEVLQDLLRYLTRDLNDIWKYILQNKFLSNNLLPLMDQSSINALTEILIDEFDNFQNIQHIFDNTTILNAIVYTVIAKCDRLISNRKRKHNEEGQMKKMRSTKIFNEMANALFEEENKDITPLKKIKRIMEIDIENNLEVTFEESKVLVLLEVARKFPILFCKQSVQNYFLLYLFSLHKDMTSEFSKKNYTNLQVSLETIILGILQQYKYRLEDIFTINNLCDEVLTNFIEWKSVVTLIIENLFRDREEVVNVESFVLHMADKLHIYTYMYCAICILNTLNKYKKLKLPKEIKSMAENFKLIICNKIYELVLTSDPEDFLLPGYVYTMRMFIAQEETEKISQLETILKSYLEFSLQKYEEFDKSSYLQLFNTVLQNKTVLKTNVDDLPLKIWKVCKNNQTVYKRFDEFSPLMLLIVGCVSNEDFFSIMEDLLFISESFLIKNKHEAFGNVLKTWVAILTSNINSIKTKKLLDSLEILISQIIHHFRNADYSKDILNFEITIVQTKQLHLSPSLIDVLILSATISLNKEQIDFKESYTLAISLLSNLLKYRKSIIMDRLPPYLKQFRMLLKTLCSKSNADETTEEEVVQQLSDCAFQLEKLTKNLVVHQKDMSRIAMYIIADTLEQYEKINIFPKVKMHLNNCLYSLLTICDQHAISYLMRVLSTASTEIFKVVYEHYKKYYRFTGKA
ncbi:uncharacterized protein LOC130901874 [Diorhabda carinulata]|uniref:uncharacterized protein LOC130901874 n=1 Tax=Diorhabda carinulata TaxID=1163345 RepID=UPI0025A045A8|nr:uncharacterized protein LOC130901874 [Diorhabda carinulata]